MTGLTPHTAIDPRHDVLLDEITDWLMRRALDGSTFEDLLTGAFDGMIAAGLPIARAYVGMTTLHPLVETISYMWQPDSGLLEERYGHGQGDTNDAWLNSPLHWLVKRRIPVMRRRLTGPEALLDFPLFEELSADGLTDYLGWLTIFDRTRSEAELGAVGSFATARQGGFTEPQIAALGRVQASLAVSLKVTAREQITENVLSAYLGEAAAEQVLNGQIQRGDGQHVQAAIWYSDLRGSTALAEKLDAETFLEALDIYFEATAGAVMAEGGQVLLLIGDAVLAIFPVEAGDMAGACAQALRATERARRDMAAINAQREAAKAPPLQFGLGLHIGELLFGNIGTRERLQFTAVGRAVNVAARLEELTKTLGHPVLASADFARLSPDRAWEALGTRSLRGLTTSVGVSALRLDAAPERAEPAASGPVARRTG